MGWCLVAAVHGVWVQLLWKCCLGIFIVVRFGIGGHQTLHRLEVIVTVTTLEIFEICFGILAMKLG